MARPERRDPDREAERTRLTPAEQAILIRERRFGNKRPADLSDQQFSGDGAVKRAFINLFDRLEGELDAEKVAKLREAFERGVDIWEQAGLFTKEREKAGFAKPDFDRDYAPLLTQEHLDMAEAGEALDRGYSTPVFAPLDIPLHSESAEKLSYFKLLKEALLKAFHGTAGGKQSNTLLIGPEKRVLTADQVDINAILWQWERYLKAGVVHNVQKLDKNEHGGVSEEEVLSRLQGNEKRTGGMMRLERDRLIMPSDAGKEKMSALDWEKEVPKLLPENARVQDLKQAIAHTIYCLEMQGWMPDYDDYQSPQTSRVNLALGSFVPDEGSKGAVPHLYWDVRATFFCVGRVNSGLRDSHAGVRAGVRIQGA